LNRLGAELIGDSERGGARARGGGRKCDAESAGGVRRQLLVTAKSPGETLAAISVSVAPPELVSVTC
jgi:hypothetical protein